MAFSIGANVAAENATHNPMHPASRIERVEMENGNNNLSSEAVEAIKRIRALREATKLTGFQTVAEQSKILLALNNTDLLAACLELKGAR